MTTPDVAESDPFGLFAGAHTDLVRNQCAKWSHPKIDDAKMAFFYCRSVGLHCRGLLLYSYMTPQAKVGDEHSPICPSAGHTRYLDASPRMKTRCAGDPHLFYKGVLRCVALPAHDESVLTMGSAPLLSWLEKKICVIVLSSHPKTTFSTGLIARCFTS
jgi:hypothetical protein